MKGFGMLVVGLATGYLVGMLIERRRLESPVVRADRLSSDIEDRLGQLETRAFGSPRPPVRTADHLH